MTKRSHFYILAVLLLAIGYLPLRAEDSEQNHCQSCNICTPKPSCPSSSDPCFSAPPCCASDTLITKTCAPTCNFNQSCSFLTSCCCQPCGVTTYTPRSTGACTSRELVQWQRLLYKCYDRNYIVIEATTAYSHSIRPERIACALFCTDCLTFEGSQVPERNEGSAVIADFFGFSTTYQKTVKIEPQIKNFILDFNAYVGLDCLKPGWYARMHMPITLTSWDIGINDCVVCQNTNRGQDQFPDCYMNSCTPDEQYFVPAGDDLTPPSRLLCQRHVLSDPFTYNENCTTQSIRQALSGDFTFGDMKERWKFGRISLCPLTKTGVADIDLITGYLARSTPTGHLAFFIQTVFPTGNTPKAEYFFEPILGNAGHAELGGGLSFHMSMSPDFFLQNLNIGWWVEGNITHMFKNTQIRSFDFCDNGQLSRYTLLKEYDADNNYIGRMINAINFTTRHCRVEIDYKVDISTKLEFSYAYWTFDIGYNFYTKDAEKVTILTDCPCDIDLRRFGIKGTTGVCCRQFSVIEMDDLQLITDASCDPNLCPDDRTVDARNCLLNTTQPLATMCTVITPEEQSIDPTATCVCMDWRDIEQVTTEIAEDGPILTEDRTFFVDSPNTPPTLVSCFDLNPNSATQCRMLSHTLFFHNGFMWIDHAYKPNIGIGGQVEFSSAKHTSTLNQWQLWVKGGLTF